MMLHKQLSFLLSSVMILIVLLANVAWGAERGPVKSLLEMRRDNVVVQKWDLSCGAAALATLLNYQHDDTISEREVAKALVSRGEYLEHPELVKVRHGFSLLDLKRYVDARGYKGIGYGKLTLEHLTKRAPIIIPIKTHGYNHFVIFRGKYGNRVLLADPAWGNRTMTMDRFERSWIEFSEIGKVGFVIQGQEGDKPSNRLAPRLSDFFTLR